MSGATVVITLDGTDITNRVIFESANFESLLNAQPGVCEFTCLDPDQDFAPVTGDEITLDVDGVRLWGGYLTLVTRTHPFEADAVPANANDYTKRYWILRGVDYNILFDKRVVRNTANYVESLDLIPGTTMDGSAIVFFMENYVDVPSGFDVSTYVDDIVAVSANLDAEADWSYVQQGVKIRDQFESLALRSEAVYYFDANKNLHWHAIEYTESRWGFSDQPNNAAITTLPNEYQDATYGFREVEATEDGTGFVNDALIWGGSEWAGEGNVVFARTEDATSISNHGRWQLGETHFGEFGYGIQEGVDARANVIVLGPPGIGVGVGGALEQKGMRHSQHSYRFAWHDKDVPSISGTKVHLQPGQLVTVVLYTFDQVQLLPLRSIRISFPEGNPANNKTYVRFDGTIGLQLSDPFGFWKYLIKRSAKSQTSTTVATVSSGSPSALYGAFYVGEPTPAPDGAETIFSIPFGYISGTLEVSINGLEQRPDIDFLESDAETGEIEFTSAPYSDDELQVEARTLGG